MLENIVGGDCSMVNYILKIIFLILYNMDFFIFIKQ